MKKNMSNKKESHNDKMNRFMLEFMHNRGYYINAPEINLLNGEVNISIIDKESNKIAEVQAQLKDHFFELHNYSDSSDEPFILYTIDSHSIVFNYPEKALYKDDHKFLAITWVLDQVAIMDEETHDILSTVIDYNEMSDKVKEQINQLPDEALNPDFYLISNPDKKRENQYVFSELLEREHKEKLEINVQVEREWNKKNKI